MLRGIETAANGMKSIVLSNDITANNLANINTVGYKKSSAIVQSFAETLLHQTENPRNPSSSDVIGSLTTGSAVNSTNIDFTQGSLKQTNNVLDTAIEGEGFFTIQKPDGNNLYTRNGSFILDDEGFLKTKEGFNVIGEKGPIQLMTNNNNGEAKKIEITEDGLVIADGNVLDNLKISDIEDKRSMKMVGNSYYEPVSQEEMIDATDYKVNQGFLESANCNVIDSMVKTIKGERAYESLAKLIQQRSGALQKVTTQVGLVRG